MSPSEPVALLDGPTRARNSAWPVAPVLISVPALASPRRRPTAFREDEPRAAAPRPRPTARRRRRLRREVRMVGVALVVALPLSWTFWSVPWPGAPAGADEPGVLAGSPAQAEAPPIVSLRLEPISPTTASVSAAAGHAPHKDRGPVALPGYIIPDDGSEEVVHAGS